MATLELDGGKVLMWFDGALVETFHDAYDTSFRTPATWLGVKAEGRKHDKVRFSVGRAGPGAGPAYGSDIELTWADVMFEVDIAEEPQMRAFLGEVAQAVASRSA